MEKMVSPATYQGAKGRLAGRIADEMNVARDVTFYDLCCGSGAVSLELIERGHAPDKIVMVDQGPWGMFWQAIGSGTFNVNRFAEHASAIPLDPREVKPYIERLFRAPVEASNAVYTFLLLQAAAIGGAPIWIQDGQWRRSGGFRDYWLPTETSSRRSPVNPMMPMPPTIVERVRAIAARARGVRGLCADAATVRVKPHSVAYIDPQYEGTTSYPFEIDVVSVAQRLGCTCWVSEGRSLSADSIRLSEGRAKGGITGDRKRAANEEWLSKFTARVFPPSGWYPHPDAPGWYHDYKECLSEEQLRARCVVKPAADKIKE